MKNEKDFPVFIAGRNICRLFVKKTAEERRLFPLVSWETVVRIGVAPHQPQHQGGSQGSNGTQGNKPNNAGQNKPVTSNQGSSTNNNNKQDINSDTNNNTTVTGIDANRVDEENTVSNDEPVVKQTDYTSKEDSVKLYKQEDNSMIVRSVCGVGIIVIIGICVFIKKKF